VRTTATDALDSADPLAGLRSCYDLPAGVIHLNGTSGGPLPKTTPARLRKFVEHRWDNGAARARSAGSWRADARQAAQSLAPLIGADPEELTVAESTSMNLFRALLVAAHLRPDRSVLAVSRDCLPTDRCLARSAAAFSGCELRLIDSTEDLADQLDDRVAVVALSHADPESGALRDPLETTREVHRWGALTLWDLSYTAGALAVDLRAWEADLAIGCGHRYLGGGQGAPAYAFVSARHHADIADAGSTGVLNPLTSGFVGSPGTLALSQLRLALSILDGVTAPELEAKTTGLVSLFLQRLDELQAAVEVVGTPGGNRHGAQVSVRHHHAKYMAQDLFARGVLAECVEPDILRFSFAPSWLRYGDVWEAAETLNACLC
jgi:kynureninase